MEDTLDDLADGREGIELAPLDSVEQQPKLGILGDGTLEMLLCPPAGQREDLGGHRIIASQRGSLMRWLVDDALAHGVKVEIVVEVAHRTSILPLVLAGVGHAVMPSSWAPTAHRAGLRTLHIISALYF